MNILNIENVTKVYGDKVLFDKVNLGINEGDKIGVIGVNGSGKSTFLKMIAGLEETDEGQIIKNNQAGIAYLAQNTEFGEGDTILSYVCRDKVSSNPNWNIEAEAKGILKKLYIEDVDAQIAPLSGGEKKRIALARTLLAPAKVLILDEPTNDLDIATLTILEDYLDSFDGMVIVVSHDRYFLDRVVDRIFAFEADGVITQYEGDYTTYMEKAIANGTFMSGKMTLSGASGEENNKPADSKATWKGNREKKLKFTYQEQREYETIDEDIAKLEERIEELEREMAAAASQYTKLQELSGEKEDMEKQLEEKMERWVYLNDLAEQIAAGKQA